MEMPSKKKKSAAKIIGIVLCVLIGLVLLAVLAARAYFRLSVREYYAASQKVFVIPEIHDGLIVQGFDYDESDGVYLITGYYTDGSASPVCLVSAETGAHEKTVRLTRPDGAAYTGHAGGLALHGNRLYIAGGEEACLFVYDYSAVRSAENGASVPCLGIYELPARGEDRLGVAFVTEGEDGLIAGEFYRAANYPTPASHHLTTPAGDENPALAVVLVYDDAAPLGLSRKILRAYSMPGLVQGLASQDGKVYLSTSYGPAFSYIFTYDLAKAAPMEGVTVLGQSVPLYALDSASRIHEAKCPPMSEEILLRDGKLYIMNESASNKYIFGKFTSARWCYATDLSYFE